MEKENKKVSIETMTGAGKEIELVGRTYTILPVTIKDMKYVIGEDDKDENLIITNKKATEEEDFNWQIFGINITDEKRKKTFLHIINNYVFYKGYPMTEELLIEHNWSFKEIGQFLLKWSQVSD